MRIYDEAFGSPENAEAENMQLTDRIGALGIVPVIKLNSAENAVPLCGALMRGGLPVAEITFRTAAAEESISLATKAFPDMLIGAGTVLTTDQADRATRAGAAFIVTPGFNPKVVAHCIERGYPVFPGCPTTSDIELAREMGLQVVKFFPAEPMGGMKTIKAVSAPYPDMRFMPTGGINAGNLREYLASSKIVACGGSWMAPDALIDKGDFAGIEALTREAVRSMHGFAIDHVAVACEGAEEAEKVARAFCRLFGWQYARGESADSAGGFVEALKGPIRGEKGHIAVRVADIHRAKAYMQEMGVHFAEGSAPDMCWLEDEIAGFGLRLVAAK